MAAMVVVMYVNFNLDRSLLLMAMGFISWKDFSH
jgi:hypothetical protein